MTEQRFWSKVNKTESCWLWTAGLFSTGYGAFSINGNNVGAHKYSYELHNSKVAEGLVVRHTCDNPPCVNPNHLLIGTPKDNTRDMIERGRHKFNANGGPKGQEHGRAKLTEDDVREIRIFREFGFTYRELGEMYGVHLSMIAYILSKKNWSHI